MSAHHANSLIPVGNGERNHGFSSLCHFRRIALVDIARSHHAILQDYRNHTDRIEPVRYVPVPHSQSRASESRRLGK
jgi:hypothetical protein